MFGLIMQCSNTFVDIWIPIISAVIGGLLTLSGVIITILWQSHKDHIEKESMIKPFIIVEPPLLSPNTSKIIYFQNSFVNDNPEQSVIFWNSLVITNCSNNPCILRYVTINDQVNKLFEPNPFKPNETIELIPYELKVFPLDNIKEISLGLYDSSFNSYEYKFIFTINTPNETINEKLKKYTQKVIQFKYIDCQSSKLSKRKEKQRNTTKI